MSARPRAPPVAPSSTVRRLSTWSERDGTLAEVAAGAHEARSGDAFIAASHASLRAGRAFFTTAVAASDDAEFRNDTLDAALASALASYTSLVGLAAARIHGYHDDGDDHGRRRHHDRHRGDPRG